MTEEHRDDGSRIVICFGGAPASLATLDTVVTVARAFRGEIEGVFIEDQQLVTLATLPFAREVSLVSRRSRALTPDRLARDIRAMASAMRERMEELAARASVPFRFAGALANLEQFFGGVQAEKLPFLALAEPLETQRVAELHRILTGRMDVGGLIITGPRAHRHRGPVVAIVEDSNNAKRVIATAARLAAAGASPLIVVPASHDAALAEAVEAASSEVSPMAAARIEHATLEDAAGAIRVLRRLGSGLLVAELGGAFLPDETALQRLAALIESPMLLIPRSQGEKAGGHLD